MRRRHLLALAGAAANGAAFPAQAQKSAMPRVGFLVAGDPEPTWTLFRKAMADLGYVEGRTVTFEYRASDANPRRLEELAVSLVGLEVDVIVAALSPAIAAARKATSKIPIVFNGAAPETGTVSSLARPEGNLTGVSSSSTTVAGKCVQLFHEIIPATKAIGVLLNLPDPFYVPLRQAVETATRAEKIEIVPVMIKTPDELPAAFEMLASRGVDGVFIQPSLGLDVTAALALKHRLPSVSFRREFAPAGGLLAYGADHADLNRIVAGYVDKVLKGARPADLPVQQATRFELVVNQKTAKAIGLVLTPTFLARADEVIE
jgi:putative tryptophan/tyrosine transport system substrate-binding protein